MSDPTGGIRRGPRLADNFTILSNEVINDGRLSYRARGILLFLLSKPADWRTRSDAIAAQSPEGRESVRTAMRELASLGYLTREKVRDPKTGRIATIQTVHEEPVEVTEPQVVPAPKMPVSRVADVGELGVFTKDRSRRIETNNNRPAREPRQCATNPRSSLSKLAQANDTDAAKLADLEAATLDAGLPASYRRIRAAQRTAILELIDQHGVPALVDAARRAHRDANPTLHVHGWLRLWQAMPVRQARRVAPKCDQCDEYGWLPDDAQGRAVRCSCRAVAA
ncbi:replication protein [Rhodococcus sp. D2-41]|uniref:replication protein n=1 Tax=Speluncibacter jeojiensis TaxID=2710754 RepID=UPI0024107679|nr:replication protein [Rhodococcus sp. D2-41]MDG3012359.1 replication protein [Rhodococcus sp. D2-41]